MNLRLFSIIHKTNIHLLQSRGPGVSCRRKLDPVFHLSSRSSLIPPPIELFSNKQLYFHQHPPIPTYKPIIYDSQLCLTIQYKYGDRGVCKQTPSHGRRISFDWRPFQVSLNLPETPPCPYSTLREAMLGGCGYTYRSPMGCSLWPC